MSINANTQSGDTSRSYDSLLQASVQLDQNLYALFYRLPEEDRPCPDLECPYYAALSAALERERLLEKVLEDLQHYKQG